MPIGDPSTKNCTLATATLSEASAVTVTVPGGSGPLAGAIIVTIGGVISPPAPIIVTVAEHRTAPKLFVQSKS